MICAALCADLAGLMKVNTFFVGKNWREGVFLMPNFHSRQGHSNRKHFSKRWRHWWLGGIIRVGPQYLESPRWEQLNSVYVMRLNKAPQTRDFFFYSSHLAVLRRKALFCIVFIECCYKNFTQGGLSLRSFKWIAASSIEVNEAAELPQLSTQIFADLWHPRDEKLWVIKFPPYSSSHG